MVASKEVDEVDLRTLRSLRDVLAYPERVHVDPREWLNTYRFGVSSLLLRKNTIDPFSSEERGQGKNASLNRRQSVIKEAFDLKDSLIKRSFVIELKGSEEFDEETGYPLKGRFIAVIDPGFGEAVWLLCRARDDQTMDVESMVFFPEGEFDLAVRQARQETLKITLDIGLRYVDIKSDNPLSPDEKIDGILAALGGHPELLAALTARMIGEKIESEVQTQQRSAKPSIQRKGSV